MSSQTALERYAREALKHAVYGQLADGSFVGRIPACKGAIAFGSDRQRCEDELLSVLEDWALLGVRLGDEIPTFGETNLNADEARRPATHHD